MNFLDVFVPTLTLIIFSPADNIKGWEYHVCLSVVINTWLCPIKNVALLSAVPSKIYVPFFGIRNFPMNSTGSAVKNGPSPVGLGWWGVGDEICCTHTA